MKKNKCCKGCYVEVRRYTIIKGILLTIFAQIILMIPVVGLILCKYAEEKSYEDGVNGKLYIGFWHNMFYRIEKQKVECSCR